MVNTILSNSTVSSTAGDKLVTSQPNAAVSTGVEVTVADNPGVQGSSDLGLGASSGIVWI